MEDISFVQICEEQVSKLFMQILQIEKQVLHQLLPPVRNVPYSFCPRAHGREVPPNAEGLHRYTKIKFTD